MLTVVKPVYYCEFCKRHRITKRSIEEHEPHCMLNPDRKCRWRVDGHTFAHTGTLAAEVSANGLDVDALRVAVGGCPGCMLAVVRQSGASWEEREDAGFSYETEVERLRQEERHADAY